MCWSRVISFLVFFFFFNDTATTEIYTLSLHDALPISATNYNSGKSYLFIQGAKGHPMWNRSRRVTLATKITVDHICASAAIPLVFQPVILKTARGTAFFGDGCVRLQQP